MKPAPLVGSKRFTASHSERSTMLSTSSMSRREFQRRSMLRPNLRPLMRYFTIRASCCAGDRSRFADSLTQTNCGFFFAVDFAIPLLFLTSLSFGALEWFFLCDANFRFTVPPFFVLVGRCKSSRGACLSAKPCVKFTLLSAGACKMLQEIMQLLDLYRFLSSQILVMVTSTSFR